MTGPAGTLSGYRHVLGLPGALRALIPALLGRLSLAMVTGYLLADLYPVAEVRTEASSWINTAVDAGAALAVMAGGAVIERFGVETAITRAVAAASLCLILPAIPLLRPSPQTQGPRPDREANHPVRTCVDGSASATPTA